MRLRTRLQAIAAATAAVSVGIVVVVAVTSAAFRDAIDHLTVVEQLEKASADLVIVTQEYVLHGHERAHRQWHGRHAALMDTLARIDDLTPQAAALAERLARHAGRMRTQFELLVRQRESRDLDPAVREQAHSLLTGQLLVESYVVTDAASSLARRTMEAMQVQERRSTTLVTAMVATLAVTVLLATLLAWRGVGGAFARLHRGTLRVAAGDFSVRVGPADGVARDEFSELALAIDTSTRALGLQRGLLSLSHLQAMSANASHNVAEALKSTLDAVCKFTGWPVGHALLQPHPGAPITTARVWHLEDERRYAELRAATEPVRYDDGHVGVVASTVKSKRPRYVAEVTPATNSLRADVIRRAGLRGHVALPVLLGDEVAAALEFFVTPGTEPGEELMATLEQIGVQLGRVLERSRAQQALSEEARRRDRTLLAMSARVAAAANEADTPQAGYQMALSEICGFTGWPLGHVLQREGEVLVSTDAWYLDDATCCRPLRDGEPGRELRAVGCLGEALSRAEPVVVGRLSAHSDPERHALMQACGLTGHVVLPVLVGREVVAVLEFLSREAMEPDPALLEVLAQVGVQLGRVVERARAGAALGERAAELARSNAELESFAYVASHDLQEPLRMVASYAQLLERRYADQLDDKARRFIGYAVEGATRMQALINGLLQISRVGSVDEPPRAVDLNVVVRTLRRELAALLAETGAELEVETLPTVRGNPEQVGQILQNLVSNALKFQPAGRAPRVRIGAERRDDMWCVSVTDNGIGIDMKYAARIFQIFQRLHSRQSYAGAGIGLTLCKKLVERHGGLIWFESRVGEGTTFHFTLPADA